MRDEKKNPPNAWAVSFEYIRDTDKLSIGPVYVESETAKQWRTPYREMVVRCNAIVPKDSHCVRIFRNEGEAREFAAQTMRAHVDQLRSRLECSQRRVDEFESNAAIETLACFREDP